MTTQHTPGPWTVGVGDGQRIVIGGGHRLVTVAPKSRVVADIQRAISDARLIAAAPDLLEACYAAILYLNDDDLYYQTGTLRETIGQAIEKAEGR